MLRNDGMPSESEVSYPILKICYNGRIRHTGVELVKEVADWFNLTPKQREERTAGCNAEKIKDRTKWAVTHLCEAGLMHRPTDGKCEITATGKEIVDDKDVQEITPSILRKIARMRQERATRGKGAPARKKLDRDSFLRSEKVLRLATADGSGNIHVAPVWYRYSGGRIRIGTASKSRKARNAAASGRASFCVDVGVNSPDIAGVYGRGPALVVTEPRAVRRIARSILSRYFDSLDAPAAVELLRETDCIIEIDPDPAAYATWTY